MHGRARRRNCLRVHRPPTAGRNDIGAPLQQEATPRSGDRNCTAERTLHDFVGLLFSGLARARGMHAVGSCYHTSVSAISIDTKHAARVLLTDLLDLLRSKARLSERVQGGQVGRWK